jgi:hypothetical protein
VLVGGDQLHRGRVVDRVGGDVADPIELAPADRLVQVSEGLRDAVGSAEALGAGFIRVDPGDHKAAGDGGEAGGVGGGPGAGAEDQNSDDGLAHR